MFELAEIGEYPDETFLKDILCLGPVCRVPLTHDEQLGREKRVQPVLSRTLSGLTCFYKMFQVIQ
jgi:hypothetical protein